MDLKGLDALILVGGLGTRLRSILPPDIPKPLAPIKGHPFLAYLLKFLAQQGIERTVLATGFLSHVMEWALEDIRPSGMKLELSMEIEPLGTGGAIGHARHLLKSDPVLVLNGDSICPVALGPMLLFHREKKALVTDLLTLVKDTGRFGSVQLDSLGRVTHFNEKLSDGSPGLINAGVYLFSKAALDHMPDLVPCSLECDILPQWAGSDVFGFITKTPFLDIGTPESYGQAENFFSRWFNE